MDSFKNIFLYLVLITSSVGLWAQSGVDCPTATTVTPLLSQSVCEGEALAPLTATITPAPVAASATDWLDLSGNGYNAVLQNGVGFDAVNGGVLTFDGIDDKVYGNSGYSVNSTSSFTIEIWFNLEDYSYSYPGLFTVKSNLNSSFYCFLTNVTGSYNLKSLAFGFGGSGVYRIPENSIIDGAWNQIIITNNGGTVSSNYKVYVNGYAQTISSSSGGNVSQVNEIGRVSSQPFKGKIPVFNLYNNKAFTAEEIIQNFNYYKNRFGLGAQEASSIVPGATVNLDSGNPLSYNNGSYTPSYQWYYNTTDSNQVAGATLINGATSANFTPPSTAADVGSRWYFCVGYATDNGCLQTNTTQALASNTTQISVNAKPNLIITNPDEVFMPSTVNLTDTAITTGSDSGSFSYWTDPSATNQLSTPEAVTLSGTYYIKLTNIEGCYTIKPVLVTITELTSLNITDPAPVCAPSTVDLTDPAVTAGSNEGTLSYWTDAGATIALVSPNAVSQSGTYYIKLDDLSGYTSIKPVQVTIMALPTVPSISAASPVCQGSNAVFTILGAAGDTVNYSGNASGVALIGPSGYVDISINGVTADTTVNLTEVSNGNCTLSLSNVTATVAVVATPVLTITNPNETYLPATVNLTDPAVTAGSDAGTLTYWSNAAATNALVAPESITTSGTYYIKLVNTEGCASIKPVIVTISEPPVSVITPLQSFSEAMSAPGKMAVDTQDKVYVTDAIQKSIIKYDANGNYISTISLDFNASAIAINPKDVLFVSDKKTGTIYRVSENGNKTLFYSGEFIPNSMVFGFDILYLTDSQKRKVIGLNSSGGIVTNFTYSSFVYPTGIAFDPYNQYILVGEHGGIGEDMECGGGCSLCWTTTGPQTSIYMFDLAGNHVSTFGCFGQEDGLFHRIQGIAVGPCGNYYAVDPYLGRVSVFDNYGNFIAMLGGYGNEQGKLNLPIDIVFTSDNHAFVSSMNKGSIEIYSITEQLPTATITSADQTVCSLENAVIEVQLTGTSPWSFTYTIDGLNPQTIHTSNITSDPQVTTFNIPVTEQGLYRISALTDGTATSGSCFTGTTNIVLTDALPTATFLTTELIKCESDGTGIEVAFTGMAPFTFTYAIDGQNPIEMTTTDNPFILIPETSGLYEILSIQDYACTGTVNQGIANINVNTLPTATIVDAAIDICTGQTDYIAIAFTGAGSSWHFTYTIDGLNPVAIETSSNPYLLPVSQPGIYALTAVSDMYCNGLVSGQVTVSASEQPVVDLGADISICTGNSYVLDAGFGFESYLWSDGSTNRILEVNTSGTYSVVVSNASGCTASDLVTVEVIPVPEVSFHYYSNVLEVQFINDSYNVDSHHWDFGDGNFSTDENPIHTYGFSGTYQVVYTATSSSCGTYQYTEPIEVVDESTIASIANNFKNNKVLDVYPNPSTGDFTLKLKTDGLILTDIHVYINNSSGQSIFMKVYNAGAFNYFEGNYYIPMSLSNFDSGTYLIYVHSGSYAEQGKIMLKH
ncbi:PKD domain-containing protein [Aestuariivivens sp. NBU2969]|uniref:PKD domain-containing protein n=1 Tax=Aestuariivivens sp. NBU2969 TaxID=2873267 RepID=UPI001CBC9A3A|nr:PKD domain-containing protein [Aestuariivivens sp. NBU2969]